MLKLGDYMPDLPPTENPGLTVAKNCLPYATHYDSMLSPVDYSSNALSGVVKGFISVRDRTGASYSYAGDTSSLYRMADSTFYSAGATAAYSTASDDVWEFTRWGERIVGTNYTNDLQVISLGASNFASLAGTPPRARHMAVIKNFLVLGNVTAYSDSASACPNRVHWSAFENINSWAPSVSTQADYQPLEGDGGDIQRVIPGEYGTIIQERAIWRMTYVGAPLVFQFDEVERLKGTPAAQSVVKIGNMIFYLGHDDFYMFNGAQSIPIGQSKVYQTFTDDYDSSYSYKVWAIADPVKPIIYWLYPGAGNIGGGPNKMIVFNWLAQKWAGPIELTLDMLCIFAPEGYTLEGLDSINTSLDALAFSLDSKQWVGVGFTMGGFSTDHKLRQFTGDALTATFSTGDRQLFPGRRALVTKTRPLIEGNSSSSISVAVSGRNLLTESASYGASTSMNADGETPLFSEGRYHRFQINVSGGFTHASGIEIDAAQVGKY